MRAFQNVTCTTQNYVIYAVYLVLVGQRNVWEKMAGMRWREQRRWIRT